MRVCVYCASSQSCDAAYHFEARRLGELLAGAGHEIVYGGGAVGSMGALADGALSAGGRVVGVLPSFMQELEWGHPGLHELEVVEDMRIRKHKMLTGSDAAVALPGGTGTFEELLEALTLKRLGLYFRPIVILNTRGFFASFLEMMDRCISERFMADRHREMWTAVDNAEDVLPAIYNAPPWDEDARRFAAL